MPCGRRRDDGHGAGGQVGELQDAHRRTARADQGDGRRVVDALRDLVQAGGLRDGQFGVAAGGEADVGDHALAEPGGVDSLAGRIDRAGHLAAGDRGQRRQFGERALEAAPDRGVQEVHAGRRDGDADLAWSRYRVRRLLVREVLGRAEGVQADGVHGGLLVGSRLWGCPPLSYLKQT